MDRQLILDVQLKDACSFENYVVGENREALLLLQQMAQGEKPSHLLYLWGADGAGKTHLLQAACRIPQRSGRSAIYLPMAELVDSSATVLDGLSDCALVLLDDIDAIAGKAAWERALLAMYEELKDRVPMVISAMGNARHIGLQLPDLVTRLGSGLVYQLQRLDDAGKQEAIKQRAANRGLEIADDVIRYVLSRYPRDMHGLFDLLDRLDKASLAEQRRLTIPFIQSLETQG
ncbi:MAG: DnaA regulatory inactivator Hda [Acidiferrobacterales bacterium]|jgi:DnaA family protein|nr:DnaA regulatory inactivator Hda [Acidiferrobacterales bacterium]